MLIAALEGPGDIYDIPLDGSQPTVELHTLNYLSAQIGAWSGYVIAAYNDMVAYPGSGTEKRPDLLIGLGVLSANYPGAWQGMYPNPTFLVRHANGSYVRREPLRLVLRLHRGTYGRAEPELEGLLPTTPIGSTGEFPNNELSGSSRRSAASRSKAHHSPARLLCGVCRSRRGRRT